MISHSLTETHEQAARFVRTLERGGLPGAAVVIGLQGDLGSGKTAFAQGVAKALGVEGDVQSPTFVIEKRYETLHARFKRLVHIDAYRLESAGELARLDWETTISFPGNLVLVEWPELVAEILPAGTKMVRFRFVDENAREITHDNG